MKALPVLARWKWPLVSALMKSMRLRRPKDALYFFHLVRQTPSMYRSAVLSRLVECAAEDSVSPWVLEDAATVWRDRADWTEDPKTELARMVRLVYAISTQPNAYTTEWYGQEYIPPKEDIEYMPHSARMARKLLLLPHGAPSTELGPAEWHRVRQLLLAMTDHDVTAEEYIAVVGYLGQRIMYVPETKFLLEPLMMALAGDTFPSIAGFDLHMGMNWLWKVAFVAAMGPVVGKAYSGDQKLEEATWALNRSVRQVVKADLAAGVIRLPTYAFDGKHCRPMRRGKWFVLDPRFKGDHVGMRHMTRMVKKYGRLDMHDQGVGKAFQVPDEWLAKPFLRIRL